MSEFLDETFADLLKVLQEIKDHASPNPPSLSPIDEEPPESKQQELPSDLDLAEFFASVRVSLFGNKLTTGQVQGIEAKLQAFQEAGYPVSWAAYALATSYHETARRMLPVREGLSASDAWRRKHLRYYPYYGRGDVQLTWRENYAKADRELGLRGALLANLDLALDPDISARVMVRGMKEGWFSKDKKGVPYNLSRFLVNNEETLVNFRQARRIINLMDKADLIAGYAIKFQTALKGAGYGTTDNR